MLYMVVRMKLFLPLLLFVLFCTNPKKEDKMDKGNIRRPAVAGKFYPGNLNELQKEVDGFLASATKGRDRREDSWYYLSTCWIPIFRCCSSPFF